MIILKKTKKDIPKKGPTLYEDFKEWFGESWRHGFIYSREVPGLNGKNIMVHKVRTMQHNVKDLDKSQIKYDGLGKIIDDPRIMNFGRVLRKYWIDELPQLFYDYPIKRSLRLIGIRPRSDNEWNELFSKEHKKNAFNHKPGIFGVHYAFDKITDSNDFSMLESAEKDYLERKSTNPIKTDTEIFLKIWGKIILKGMRSR